MNGSQLPTHSLESERAILAACMYSGPEVIEEVSAFLTPQAFYTPAHQHTFAAILTLYRAGEPTEPTRVYEHLRQEGRAKEIGGPTELVRMMQATPAIAYPVQHARLIQGYYQQRQAMHVGYRLMAEISQPMVDVQSYLMDISQRLSDIALDQRIEALVPLSEIMGQVKDYVLERYEHKADVTGVPTGIVELDRLTTGRHGGDLTVVAGRPGMGKTSFVTGWALYEARHGYAVPFFSLEMPALQVGLRLLSVEARIDIQRLRTGNVRAMEWERFAEALKSLAELPIYIDDSSAMHPAEIQRRVALLRRELGRHPHPAVTKGLGGVKVDYLQLMRAAESRHNREEEIAAISRDLKLCAKELDLPVDVVSQLNRAAEQRKIPRPTMGDLRNSGAIEQDADIILLLYRDEYYFKDTPDHGIAEVIIAKQRNGPTATVKTKWTGAYARFDNLARDPDYEEPEAYDDFPGGL